MASEMGETLAGLSCCAASQDTDGDKWIRPVVGLTGALGSSGALSSDVKEGRGVMEQAREKVLFYTKGHTALGTVCMQQLLGGRDAGPVTNWLAQAVCGGGRCPNPLL